MINFSSPITFHHQIYCEAFKKVTAKVVGLVIWLLFYLTHFLHSHQSIGMLCIYGNEKCELRRTRARERSQQLWTFLAMWRRQKLEE